jgi:hypothetical protein
MHPLRVASPCGLCHTDEQPTYDADSSTERFICIAFAYFLAFAHLFFCAAEILARTAALMRRFFTGATCLLLPFKAAIAASTPANFLASVARSSWSILSSSVIGLLWVMILEIL